MLEIIYEDECLLALNKPAGINSVIVKDGGPSIAAALIAKDLKFKDVAEKPGDGGLLHRLDRETSGVLLVAKDRKSWELLSLAINSKDSAKRYLALLEGKANQEVCVENYLGSPHRGAKKIKVYEKKPSTEARAQLAKTQFNLVKYNQSNHTSLVAATIQRGKRHQIRAHAAWAGHPLVGDTLYGSTKVLREYLDGAPPEFFLHAERVDLLNPISGKQISIVAPLPKYGASLHI